MEAAGIEPASAAAPATQWNRHQPGGLKRRRHAEARCLPSTLLPRRALRPAFASGYREPRELSPSGERALAQPSVTAAPLVLNAGEADDLAVRLASRKRLVVSSVAAAQLVVLILTPATASGGYAPASVSKTSGVPVTLTVSISGDGGGWVTSYPAGISCGSTCSAQFPDGTMVSLGYTDAVGSSFVGWSAVPSSYGETCPLLVLAPGGDTVECSFSLSDSTGDASVQATFHLNPPPAPLCTVPDVEGRTLAAAEARIRNHHCGVGRVRHVFSRQLQKGRVISQSPPAGWQREQGARVKLVVSKGRR